MCGIAGAFAFSSDSAPPDAGVLARVAERMRSRGPDGEGFWQSPDRRVAFAHRRLATIDLSERGAQPMHSRDGRYTITFNGEIYNHRELRASLESDGVQFASDSDTEVLLALFARDGAAMLPKLRGMFAFAVWDSANSSLFLARDTFGIKPLYFGEAERGGSVWFASQVRALCEAPVDKAHDATGEVGFLLWGSVPEPRTLFRGIRALPAGHSVRIDRDGVHPAVPFLTVREVLRDAERASRNSNALSPTEALAEISAAVHASVAAHHIADVPVGVFLSAGLDSAMLALSSARLANEPIDALKSAALTLGFEEFADTEEDEVPLARHVAALAGAFHHVKRVSRADFSQQSAALFAAMDQPSIDGVNTWFVSRVAQRSALKVALSGLGGDEIFASYPSFTQIPMIARRTRALAKYPGIGRSIRRASQSWLGKFTSPKYAGLLEYGGSVEGAYLLRRALFMPWEIGALVGAEVAETALAQLDTLGELRRSFDGIDSTRLQISALEMQWYMRNQLLRDADWAGMGHSLEIRVPFVDVELVRRCAAVFAAHPNITKKQVAQAVAPNLPDAVINRPKTGFVVPVREWLASGEQVAAARGLRGWARLCQARQAVAEPLGLRTEVAAQ
jgi:asparagine synthase (glutamine-hydrolysing)